MIKNEFDAKKSTDQRKNEIFGITKVVQLDFFAVQKPYNDT